MTPSLRLSASLTAVCAVLALAACERSTDHRGTTGARPPAGTSGAGGTTTTPSGGSGATAPNNPNSPSNPNNPNNPR